MTTKDSSLSVLVAAMVCVFSFALVYISALKFGEEAVDYCFVRIHALSCGTICSRLISCRCEATTCCANGSTRPVDIVLILVVVLFSAIVGIRFDLEGITCRLFVADSISRRASG